ncbi:MAG: hypothetical protein ACFFC9_16110, partial [Promethearchaeota archaeon]
MYINKNIIAIIINIAIVKKGRTLIRNVMFVANVIITVKPRRTTKIIHKRILLNCFLLKSLTYT